MPAKLKKEIDRLKNQILKLGAEVESSVRLAVKSVLERDSVLAKKIIDKDEEIDSFEVEIEEDCLKILALHQPVAIDLRFIVAVLKINSDLERIGDLAVNIAEREVIISSKRETKFPLGFEEMSEKALIMLRKSLEALINLDTKIAAEVIDMDDALDDMNRRMYDRVKENIRAEIENLSCMVQFLTIARNLERMGDLATNICEDVIYMVDGDIVRHQLSSG
ncbi:MAG: phosphate signaling complex protein PhoU [Candidatus Zixiibacteriota bacterium]|nr:MAG: phosphate signaling complex protein PhoU [candidate division Zixibacteria bacterium]